MKLKRVLCWIGLHEWNIDEPAAFKAAKNLPVGASGRLDLLMASMKETIVNGCIVYCLRCPKRYRHWPTDTKLLEKSKKLQETYENR